MKLLAAFIGVVGLICLVMIPIDQQFSSFLNLNTDHKEISDHKIIPPHDSEDPLS